MSGLRGLSAKRRPAAASRSPVRRRPAAATLPAQRSSRLERGRSASPLAVLPPAGSSSTRGRPKSSGSAAKAAAKAKATTKKRPASARPSLSDAAESGLESAEAEDEEDLFATDSCDGAPMTERWHAADLNPEYFEYESGKLSEGYWLEMMIRDDGGTDRGLALAKMETIYAADEHGLGMEVECVATERAEVRRWALEQLTPRRVLIHLCRGVECGAEVRGRKIMHVHRWRRRFADEISEEWMSAAVTGQARGGGRDDHDDRGPGNREEERGERVRREEPVALADGAEAADSMPPLLGGSRRGAVAPPPLCGRLGEPGPDALGPRVRGPEAGHASAERDRPAVHHERGSRTLGLASGASPALHRVHRLGEGLLAEANGGSLPPLRNRAGLEAATISDHEGAGGALAPYVPPREGAPGAIATPRRGLGFSSPGSGKRLKIGNILANRAAGTPSGTVTRRDWDHHPAAADDIEGNSSGGELEVSKKTRSKKKSAKRRSKDDSDEDGDSGSEESLFRLAPPSHGKLDNRIARVASENPGALLREGLVAMRKYLDPRVGVGGGATLATGETDLQPVAMSYFLQIVKALRGSTLGVRNERELQTLAQAIDMILAGRLAEAADCLIQRFKAVETASIDNNWSVASRLELLPPTAISAVSSREREAAVNLELQEQKLKSLTQKSRGG